MICVILVISFLRQFYSHLSSYDPSNSAVTVLLRYLICEVGHAKALLRAVLTSRASGMVNSSGCSFKYLLTTETFWPMVTSSEQPFGSSQKLTRADDTHAVGVVEYYLRTEWECPISPPFRRLVAAHRQAFRRFIPSNFRGEALSCCAKSSRRPLSMTAIAKAFPCASSRTQSNLSSLLPRQLPLHRLADHLPIHAHACSR